MPGYEVRLVSANGGVRRHRGRVNRSHVLAGEYVAPEEIEDAIWALPVSRAARTGGYREP